MRVEPRSLDADDTAELGELLGFVAGWLDRDGEDLADSLARFVGGGGYDIDGLRADLARFAFLLGSGDSEPGGDEQ